MSLQAAFDGFPGFPHFPPLPAQFLVQPSAHPAPDLIPSTPVNMTSPVVFSPSGCLHPKDGHPTSGMYTAHTPTMAHPVQVSISDESRYHSVASSAGQEGRDQFLKASGRSSTNLTVPDPESPTAGRGNSAQGLPETDTLEQRRATHASEFKIPADQHEQAICSLRAGLMDLDRECNFDEWFEMQVVHIDRISQAKRQMENKFESLLCSLKAEDLD
ncbi:hypothetical protein EJ06DRAFT_9639 [Trichodelitschia bisporula]|uniref:Uncharacterized protein n=1 Tax=Trichodelitschia bisporula TaxID=703511 RepID=A0A6G1I9S2_9PEZI|nr:hypothetical protein EJ06DRAFT_9639 [Trichodelitschia bisporula]